MEWNCNNCGREIISEKTSGLCLECWWKNLVEKTEINPETIRNFMEKYYFVFFKFNKSDYCDDIQIGVHANKITPWMKPYRDYLERDEDYYPKTKRNKVRKRTEREFYNEYSAFLEKLFYFAENKKIKRITANYNIEIKNDEEFFNKQVEIKKVLFKVSDIVIEKKTSKELEEE